MSRPVESRFVGDAARSSPWMCRGTATASWARGALGVALGVLLVAGCASYVDRMAPVKAELRSGNVQAALARLDARFKGHDDDLVYLMERGLLLRYAGRLDESNTAFERAEQRADDLYTKSISQNAASLLTADTILPYEGEDFERVLIHYYRALNYLDLGQTEGALVECRKAQRKLQFYEESHGEGSKKYRTDPFVHYLMGLIQESAGDLNDAYVSYKKAVQGFQDQEDVLGVALPASLVDDLFTATHRLSFFDEVDYLRRQYPSVARRPPPPPGDVELIVLVEVGFAPSKVEMDLRIPILESEKNEDPARLTGTLRERAYERRSWQRVHYWLRMALPAYPPAGAPPWRAVEVEGEPAMLVENIEVMARASLDDRMPRVLLKTIARALAKYLATTKSEDAVAKKHGSSAGSAVGAILNLAAVATEQADLRAWLGLPREIHMVRLHVPAERRQITIRVAGQAGGVIAQESIPVRHAGGPVTFVAHRVFL